MKSHLHGKEIRIKWWQLVALILINIPVRTIGRKAIQPSWTYSEVMPDATKVEPPVAPKAPPPLTRGGCRGDCSGCGK